MAEFPLWGAIEGVKQGLSANKAYRAYQAGGGKVARGTFLKLYGEARNALAQQAQEITRPLNAKPRAAETLYMTLPHATGYMQYVDIFVRDKVTGEVFSTPYAIKSDELQTRGDIIETALSSYGVSAERYEQQILGATYTATYLMGPAGGI